MHTKTRRFKFQQKPVHEKPHHEATVSSDTAKNTVISPNFMVCKFCGKAQFPHSFGRIRPKLCGNCAFPQNLHNMKLGEITVFFAV